MRVMVKITLCGLVPDNQMGRERARGGDSAMMTIKGDVRLWPAQRVIFSVKAVFTQENLTITAERGLRDAILVGTGDEMSAVEDKCPNPAVRCSNAS